MGAMAEYRRGLPGWAMKPLPEVRNKETWTSSTFQQGQTLSMHVNQTPAAWCGRPVPCFPARTA